MPLQLGFSDAEAGDNAVGIAGTVVVRIAVTADVTEVGGVADRAGPPVTGRATVDLGQRMVVSAGCSQAITSP